MRSCKRNDYERYSLLEDLASCNLVDWNAHTRYYGDGDVVTSQKTGTFENSMESLGTDYSSDAIILVLLKIPSRTYVIVTETDSGGGAGNKELTFSVLKAW